MINLGDGQKLDKFFNKKLNQLDELRGKLHAAHFAERQKLEAECVKQHGSDAHHMQDTTCPYCGFDWIPF